MMLPVLPVVRYSEVCPILSCPAPTKKKLTERTCQIGNTSGYISLFALIFEMLKI